MEKRGNKVEEKESDNNLGFHILDIPIHILSEIMIKLPAVSIVRCSSVCSKFKSIISDSSFKQTYFSKAPISFIVLSDHHRLSCIDSSSQFPNSNHGSSSCMAVQWKASTSSSKKRKLEKQLKPTSSSRFVTFHIHRRMNLINSSNGLLCLRASNYHSHSLYYISNPLLGEILTVPPAPSSADFNLLFSGFGFDPKTKNFKILQLVKKPTNQIVVAELYQSDSSWTVIPNAPSAVVPSSSSSSFDPSLNGALHWITNNGDDTIISQELICSFDLNTNKFKWVPPPSHFDNVSKKISGISVGVLKGCLCLCYVIEGARFETWLMEKYGVKESWRKAFSIDIKSYCGLSPQDKHRPIGFNSSGDMWVKADSDSHSQSQSVVSFSPETGVFRHIDIGAAASNIQATPHVLSYVSIKEMVTIRHRHLQYQTLRPDKSYALGINLLLMGGNFR